MNLKSKLAWIFVVVLAGCFPKEDPILPKPRVNKTVEINAGESKQEVNFYSLGQDSVLASVSPMEWDLYIDEDVIRVNYFRSMRVAQFDDTWDKWEDTVGMTFRYLTTSNDSGLGQWELAADQIYILDYGLDEKYQPIGLTSIRIERDGDIVKVWHNEMGSDFEVFETVGKPAFYYNLREKRTVSLPLEREYDFALGKFTDFVIFPDVEEDYLVYGAVMGGSIAVEVTTTFGEVTSSVADTISFSPADKTAIGWDWKWYDLIAKSYNIRDNRIYVIASIDGYRYKLRFTSFYNTQGVSGHPVFEYVLL